MLRLFDDLTSEAQSVFDDLWAENLIPFQLTAHKVKSVGLEEYIVRFHDSRLHSVDVPGRTSTPSRMRSESPSWIA